MAIHITLLDEAGNPFAAGLGVELLRDQQPLETAFTQEGGVVVFTADPAGPYHLRMLAPDALVTPDTSAPGSGSTAWE